MCVGGGEGGGCKGNDGWYLSNYTGKPGALVLDSIVNLHVVTVAMLMTSLTFDLRILRLQGRHVSMSNMYDSEPVCSTRTVPE